MISVIPAKKIGFLEVICGPMFSGKSEELIRRIRRARIARQNVLTFKHAFDNRHLLEYVVSHNGSTLDAFPVKEASDIISEVCTHNAQIVGIDEVQFFSNDIISCVHQLVHMGRRVIVAGLDLDFRGVPFGPMPTLMALADDVTKLQAICTECGNDAHHTQRLVNGNPARFDDPIILVGAQEVYQARCNGCFIIDRAPMFM